jgi:hypothetical protein
VNLVKSVFFTVLIAFCVTIAHASDVDGYLGISVGQSDFEDACSGCDDTDTAGKIFVGVHREYFGFETAFVWFGEAPTPTKSEADDMFGVQMQGVGIYPVNDQFSGFAKIGGLVYEGDEIDTDVTWALGAGIQYNFKYGFGIRAEYERFSDIDSVGDTSLISAGLFFNFD